MDFVYQFGGVRIASREPLAGLHPLDRDNDQLPVIDIAPGHGLPPVGDAVLYTWAGSYGLTLWSCGEGWLFEAPDVGSLLVDGAGARITGFPDPHASPLAFADLLVARILPRIAVLRGALGLHAAAVSRQGQALLLLGPSGAGKSTLSTALARQSGWRLLTDDAAIIDSEALLTWPAARGSGLWSDSRNALEIQGAADAPPPRRNGKLRIPDDGPALSSPAVVKGVIFLNRHQDFTEPRLVRLSGFDVIAGAARQILRFHPGDARTAPAIIERLAALANGVVGYRLDYPSDYAALPAVEALLATCLDPARPA